MKRMFVLLVVVGLIGCQFHFEAAAEEGLKEAPGDFLSGIKKPTRLVSDASQACWSPDETRICYTRHPGGQDSAGGISILTLDGSGKTQDITSDGKDATWSPDGKWIAYLREGKEGFGESVWLVRADSEGEPIFLDEGGSVYWSPDSKSVIYHSRRDRVVYRMPIAEGERQKEKLLNVRYMYPRPSPDGKEIAYLGSGGLCISAMDGSGLRTKPIETKGFCGGWSPDGKMIAYGGFAGSGLGLRVIGASLKEEPQVLLPGHWSRPSWSPDGRFISYDTMSSPLSVWIMNVEQIAAAASEGKPIVSGVEEASAPETQVLALTPIWAIRYPDEVYCVAFSPDGKGLLAGSADGTLKLWDVKTGEEIRSYPGHAAKVASVAFSSDGQRIVTGSWDATAKLWDAATAEVIRTFSGHRDSVEQAGLSPDGTKVVTSCWDGTAKIWDATTGNEIRTLSGHAQCVDWAEFSPDSTKVVTAGYDGTVRLWNVETGQQIRSFSGHTGPVHGARFSRDGKKLLTASTDSTVRLWDVETGEEIRTFRGHSTSVWSCAFSPDETKIATGGSYEKTAKVWDVATGEVIRTFAGHSGNVDQVAFSPDGTKLASACHDKVLRLWDVGAAAAPERRVTVAAVEKPVAREPDVLAFDDFDGKLSLDWHVLKADPTHFSLAKNPGMLTITTQGGALGAERTDYRNLFVIDCPTKPGADFEITTSIVSFKPVRNWNQAGLICYNDDDSFLKWVYEWTGDNVGNPRRTFTRGRETGGSPAYEWLDAPQELDKVWLRVSKQGNSYTFWTSLDGKSFRSHGTRTWSDGSVKQVGLLAKNGTPSTAPDIDAVFDFFEVRSPAAEAEHETKPLARVEAGKYRIPDEYLQIPDEMQACAAKLRNIGEAIKKYEKDKGKLPDWLSDLVPDYLSKEALLCPDDTTYTTMTCVDPKLPCSYNYEFAALPFRRPSRGYQVYGDWKRDQMKLFGDLVPVARCHHHQPKHLNLSIGGDMYWSNLVWEELPKPDHRSADERKVEEVTPAPVEEATPTAAEVKQEAIRPAEAPRPKLEIPEGNRQIPDEMQACAAKLREIHTAIKKYEKDKGKLPDWLSDLVPDYLTKEALLCPDDTTYTTMTCVDPKLPCSYNFEFSITPTGPTTFRDWKLEQMKLFGDVVPLVRCHHHGKHLNFSVGGAIYWTELWWEHTFKAGYQPGDERAVE